MEGFQNRKEKEQTQPCLSAGLSRSRGDEHKYKTDLLILAPKTKAELSHWYGLANSALSTRCFWDLVTFSPHHLGHPAPLFSSLLDFSYPRPCWCTKISHLLWKAMVMVQQMSIRRNRKARGMCFSSTHQEQPLELGSAGIPLLPIGW